MSNLPRNKWISYGLMLFIGFILILLFSVATVDLSFDSIGIRAIQIFVFLLPILSFVFCLYGLFTMEKTKESGSFEAVGITILLGVYGVLVIHSYLT